MKQSLTLNSFQVGLRLLHLTLRLRDAWGHSARRDRARSDGINIIFIDLFAFLCYHEVQ